MDTVQFDEDKESVHYVCSSGGGYGWGEIYYDSETGKWYEHSYYCESVDICEDHDGGVCEIDNTEYVIETLIEKNDLCGLLTYYRELDAENKLGEVLEGLQKSHGGNLKYSRWLESPYKTYYRFANGDYSVWFSDVFYSPDGSGERTVDYHTVSRILKEKDTVRIYRFRFDRKKWVETDLEGNEYSESDPIEYPEIEEKKNDRPADVMTVDPPAANDKESSSAPTDEVDAKPAPKKKGFFAKLFRK